MKPRIDLDEFVELVDFPNRLFTWSLDTVSGEVLPGPDDAGQVVPLPQLTETQILDWMHSFAGQCSETRMQALLETALKHTAPRARFLEILSVNPRIMREWEGYFNQKRRNILIGWLKLLEEGS